MESFKNLLGVSELCQRPILNNKKNAIPSFGGYTTTPQLWGVFGASFFNDSFDHDHNGLEKQVWLLRIEK